VVGAEWLGGQAPPFRYRFCNAVEQKECEILCGARGVESSRVVQTVRVTRVVDRNGAVKILRSWEDGGLSCSCNEPTRPEPLCGDNCVKVLTWVAVLAAFIHACVSKQPPPDWAPQP